MKFVGLILAFLITSLGGCGTPGETKPVTPPENEQIALPERPRDDAWIPFTTDARELNQFAVDALSLGIMPWGEVRYTLRVVSASSIETVRYEGIMCATRTWRLLAFLRSDGLWSEAREPKWQDIHARSVNDQHHALQRDYLCELSHPRRLEEIIRELKKPPHQISTTR